MSFTKISAAGIGSTGTVTLENIVVTGGIDTPIITGAASTANVRSDSLVVSGVSTFTSLTVGSGGHNIFRNHNSHWSIHWRQPNSRIWGHNIFRYCKCYKLFCI